MKRLSSVFLSIVICLCFSLSVFAEESAMAEEKFIPDEVYVSVEYTNIGTVKYGFPYDLHSHSSSNIIEEHYSWDNKNDHPDVYYTEIRNGVLHGGTLDKVDYRIDRESDIVDDSKTFCVVTTEYIGLYAGWIYPI